MNRATGPLLVLSLSAALAVGCGDSGNNSEDSVRSVVQQVDQTAPELCDHMSEKFLDQLYNGNLERCKRQGAKDRTVYGLKVESISIDGDRAVVLAQPSEGPKAKFELIKQDDDWKLHTLGLAQAPPKASTEKPNIVEGRSARATVESYYQAIGDSDAASFCGLLSQTYASQVTGNDSKGDAVVDCVEQLQDFDWSKARRAAARVEPIAVTRADDDSATVKLSNGKSAHLKKTDGRWVIDGITG